jgi:urease accessory protein
MCEFNGGEVMKSGKTIAFSWLLLAIVYSSAAEAHLLSEEGERWITGLLHPFAGIDHLLAALAVGMFASRLTGRLAILPPLLFILAMGLAFVTAPPMPAPYLYETGITLSLFILGVMLVLPQPLRLDIGLPLIAIMALAHGSAHFAEGASGGVAAAWGVGLLFATAFLHVIGLSIGRVFRQELLRLGGGVLILTGMILTLA